MEEMEGKEKGKSKSRSKSTSVSAIVLVAVAFALFMVAPAIAGTVSYEYDDAGRLVKADYGGGTAIEYVYDDAGNLLTVTVTALVLNCTCGDICVNETGWWRDGGDFNPSNAPIQYAIDNATAGETICVKDGAYNENVDVDKRLTIRSENGSANCIVNASVNANHVFDLGANYVNISGFTVQNATNVFKAGIYIGTCVEHCNISNNIATNNYYGIYLESSSNSTLTNNTANSNIGYGIFLNNADDNNITCNWVAHNDQRGFSLTHDSGDGSTGNNISYNNIMHNGEHQLDGSYHWNFYNDQNDPVDAKHNYWVATTNETIDPSIYDNEDGKGEVTFYPFETIPPPCAPIPEAATIILFSMGLVVLAGYVRVRRKD